MDDLEFKLNVTGSLARLETNVENYRQLLDDHTEQDAVNFESIDRQLQVLAIDDAVAKASGGLAGAKWGAGVTAVIIAAAEALKAVLS